ncbi:MAG: relaxase domain-containing protein [Actinomycetales bacterium]|nr:relaxase domain-containing protein [Actinomycetales bacterium]
MSIHKLTAGSGYDYLTRQVAAQDVTEKGHTSLASYYSAKGEEPGQWLGSGLAGIDGLSSGDEVTADQMRNLFGAGRHPLAEQLRLAAAFDGQDEHQQDLASRLGTPFKVHARDVSEFRLEVARRVEAFNTAQGQHPEAAVQLAERARIRTEVGVELFRREFGRDPADARELAATIAKHSRPRTNAVAGFDLTVSPVKSVSTLWAVADRPTAAAIERAHDAAVGDALAFLESTALFTREGTNGVRQVETRGLVAVAFTHRDSRAGDPDLHTHVAVANKVQTRRDGRWLAIDGRVLFAANVAASETYNTSLERHLTDALGVRFEARPEADSRKRPVREITGVDPALAQRWSSRRATIDERRAELARLFQATHSRPPTPVESIQLAQQATLETREAKHEPRSLAEQRQAWAAEARETLGGDAAVRAMVDRALRSATAPARQVDAAWVEATATLIRDEVQARRATWRRWHVQAEALRQVRGIDVPTADVPRVVDLLVDEVLTRRSVAIPTADDDVDLPAVLRRSDGSSVYTVAGSALFTSAQLLAAEQRIVAQAGRADGSRAQDQAVDQAMRASAAEGLPLNAGQATLVREMATSGRRVQLAIAPAGAGKTTAMRALATAWTHSGGDVVGLAPSAAAAAILGEHIATRADTLAKLVWHIDHDDLPGWAEQIGPRTLVVVDEAGMADTLSLDTVVGFVTARGGSVRLVGDDQQLASVGAGGVLRDIRATHGCLHLSELMRFADPAEGAASLALREGLPESLGFYLDRQRVHVGDLSTITDSVFEAWRTDRHSGRDSVMLAPTRDLVHQLNQRAQAWRLAGQRPERTAALADGSTASTGDVVITRLNERRLRTGATDWVKNGDRWQVVDVHDDGSVKARHTTSGRTVTLPHTYVAAYVELGYASTIHTAQGVTADTSHTVLTGNESRQLAYTASTRGRHANHLYLEVVDDGDPHNLIRPDHIHPLTAVDILERILASDGSAVSATTTARDAQDPAGQLTHATARYLDSLYVGAEQLLGAEQVARLDTTADHVVPGLTGAPAWPTLRAHLIVASAQHGTDPLGHLHAAANTREIDSAADPAAVLDWRLDATGLRNAGAGPLQWLPGIPHRLAEDGEWGPYLAMRAAQVRALTADVAEQVRDATTTPAWAREGQRLPDADLLVDVAVWRAATGVRTADRRPTGPAQLAAAPAKWQSNLNARLALAHAPALAEWSALLHTVLVDPGRDEFAPVLAERLAALSRAGIDAPALVRGAAGLGSLPDDHAAAALWWRIAGRLTPAVAAQVEAGTALTTTWDERLPDIVGADQADALHTSPWWPALVTVVDHAIARGTPIDELLADYERVGAQDLDPCQAMVWRISLLTDPAPDPDDPLVHAPAAGPNEPEPNPFDTDAIDPNASAPTPGEWAGLRPVDATDEPPAEVVDDAPEPHQDDDATEPLLTLAAAARRLAGPLPPTDRQIDARSAREFDAAHGPVPPGRILELNRLAADFYASRFPGSWAQTHLVERLGVDLAGDVHVQPGYAPRGWTILVDHLRAGGATDVELTESGLASVARTGRLIDRFRDRLVLPITRTGPDGQLETIGFVGRRHPDADDSTAGPKYLNTPETPVFSKGAQFFTIRADLLASGATPVLVEGPMDALAVSLASGGDFVGLAPLGTALTEDQALELATAAHEHGTTPIVATDADAAGDLAAQRDYWLLAQHAIAPNTVAMRPGSDPADLLAQSGRVALRETLRGTRPLSERLIAERLEHLRGLAAVRAASNVAAAANPDLWDAESRRIADTAGIPLGFVRRELATALERWDHDPRDAATEEVRDMPSVRARSAEARTLAAGPSRPAPTAGRGVSDDRSPAPRV